MSYKLTNRMFLEKLSDRELAEWLAHHLLVCPQLPNCIESYCVDGEHCVELITEWLNEEVGEG